MVVPYDLSDPGGGVKHHALHLADVLRARGDEVTVLGPASSPVDRSGVVGFAGVVNFVSNGSDNRMGIFIQPWKVASALKAMKLDVLHVHEPLVPALTYWASWLSPRVPKVVTFHAFAEDPPLALRAGQRFWGRTLYPFIDRGIAVSEPAARYARIAWHRPLSIIGNGISTDLFAPGPPIEARRPLRLLFVGQRADARKGFPFILEAYRMLRARGVAVTLDLVGGRGPLGVSASDDGITDHGPVSLGDLVRHYQQCDIYVAPSTSQESFGIVLLEAMSCGRPIVCSDIEGYRQVVHPDGARLVPPRDAAALADAIVELGSDVDRRRAMGAVNRVHARTFDWRALGPRVREIYVSAVDRVDEGAVAGSNGASVVGTATSA